MKWTDVAVGPMEAEQIGKEIVHYLNSCKQPSKLWVSIKRQDDGMFYTKIYMKLDEFKRKIGCAENNRELCPTCLGLLIDVFVY